VLPPGSEIAFLAPLSIDLFDPGDRLSQALTRFGVHTVRDLLRLPRRALAHRLGPEILSLSARARGEELEVPLTQPTDRRVEEALDLEHAIDHLEPLRFVLRGLISRLTERLLLRSLACGTLDLRLALEGGGHDVRRVGVAAPTRDVRVLLRLVVLGLETRPPEAPVESVSLATEGRPARADQLDLFRPRGPDPSSLDRTLCELESLCGPGRVGAPEVADDHRPDAFGLKPFEPRPTPKDQPREPSRATLEPGGSQPGSLSVRALRPPVAAQVQVHRGRPSSIRSAVSTGHVVHAAGPWRTTGRWWSEEQRFAVDYFDLQVSDGTLLRIRFDWIEKTWHIDAVYD
jgi:protein ImuB